MAITPIDLQTLFTQLDKVGRTHASVKENQPLQQVIQDIQIQKKTEEQINQVNETQGSGDGAQKVDEHGRRDQEGSGGKKNNEDEPEDEEKKKANILNDPNLGSKIDISL